jgi:glycosyltransferase 2 family protein
MKKKLIFIIKFLISIGLLSYLFLQIDWSLFLNNLENANIILIIISAFTVYSGMYISILRWDVFLKSYGIKINKLKLYSLYSIGIFFNNFLPTTIGGDVYKFINLSKNFGDKKKEIASSIILERGSGFFTILLINIFLAPFFYKLIILDRRFLFLEMSILLGFALILFFIKNHHFLLRIEKLIKKEISLVSKFNKLVISLSNIKNKKSLIYGILYSFLFSFNIAIAIWMLFYALGIEVNIFYILLINTITRIVGIIPISLNSIGIAEGLSVFLYYLIDVPVEFSLPVALIGRVVLVITSSLASNFYFLDKKIKY